LRILLVDDEEEFVTTLCERLRIRGFDTEVALNGEEAIALVERRIPDVIVLDLKMPGIDGLTVLGRLQSHHPEVRVIILTGHGSEKDKDCALRQGACGYLQKPVDIDALVDALKDACRVPAWSPDGCEAG